MNGDLFPSKSMTRHSSLLSRALRQHQERELRRVTVEVYGDTDFAQEEADLAEEYFGAAPEADL